jgi:hypothetical protein
MLLELLACLLLFFLLTFGLAWPLVARWTLDPAEKLAATAVLSWLGAYLFAFVLYLAGWPPAAFWILPGLALAGLVARWTAWRETLLDQTARSVLLGQLLVTGWVTGWLFFIVSYSGGGWTSDWFEHWERTRFFLERWPHDTKFLGIYALPARPPLANFITGALLAVTSDDFAHYQLFTALLNSLAFLPAAILVRRFASAGNGAGRVALALLPVLLMLNPSFVQNATFAWTKLTAVFFILSGLYFFLRTLDPALPRAAGPLCALALAAGILTHYSAGPYVLLLAIAWPLLNRARWAETAFWRETALLGFLGAAVLATWFGWSVAVYGGPTTLLSNSSVAVKDVHTGNQLVKIALNLRDTLVPHFLRTLDGSLIAQSSPWGYWRDWCFQLYQLNLFFVFGSVAWLALLRELPRAWTPAPSRCRWFWVLFAGGVILLGVAVHGARDTWGLAHICLQALVVLGLAFLATRWTGLTRGWRVVLVAGASVDFCLGIALSFAVQSYSLDFRLNPGRPAAEMLRSYSGSAFMNLAAKLQHGLVFFGEVYRLPGALVLALLAGILTLAITRAARRPC